MLEARTGTAVGGNGATAPVAPTRSDAARDLLPVLIVMHGEHSSPGRIGLQLRRRGHRLDIRKPRFGCALPSSLEGYAGAVVFGGPMSANDCDDFIKREIDWIGVPLAQGVPFLGVCLGAQMLAKHLGAPVTVHPEALVEIGYCPIAPTTAGAKFGVWPEQVYHWHREGFELPRGATLLAHGATFQNQAYAYGPAAVGVQFHPEITYALVNKWSVDASHRLGLKGAQSRDAQLAGHMCHAAAVDRWLDGMLGRWLTGAVTG